MRRHAKAIVAISVMLLSLALGPAVARAAGAPEAISLPVGPVTETTAVTGGWVNPNGLPTTYFVQYATQADFSDASSFPASEDASAGSGEEVVPVSLRLDGLDVDTTYYFRVVAENSAGSDTSDPVAFGTLAPAEPEPGCPNDAFRTGPSASLSECRAFERVSPADKNGTNVNAGTLIDGDLIQMTSLASFLPGDPHYRSNNPYLAERTSAGWSTRSGFAGPSVGILDLSEDHGQEIISAGLQSGFAPSLVPQDTDTGIDLYTRDGSGYHLVSAGSEGGNSGDTVFYGGQSADGSHVIFETAEHLEPEDPVSGPGARVEGNQVYERVGGQTRVVGILPDERCAELSLPAGCVDPGGAVIGDMANSSDDGLPAGASGQISRDGSRIFFESPDPATGGIHQLYARTNGTETIHVSASRCERVAPVCEDSGHAAIFQGASKDGSVVYFTTKAQLLDSDLDSGEDIYRYGFQDDELTIVSNGCLGPDGTEVDCGLVHVLNHGVGIVSDDGRRLYFVGEPNPVLVSSQYEETIGGLYIYDSEEGIARYIAPAHSSANYYVTRGLRRPVGQLDATSDGRSIVFESKYRLTAYDNSSPPQGCTDPTQGFPQFLFCSELYRYQASTGVIDCISCRPSGERPTGRVNFAFGFYLRAGSLAIAGGTAGEAVNGAHTISFISDDGKTIVFETSDAVLPQDTNGNADVYEWHSGKVSMLTSGTSDDHSRLAGISPDGQSIFLSTNDPLVPSDGDELRDVYDARIDGGLLADHPASQPAPCGGDVCKGPPTFASEVPSSQSSTFSGPGNVKPGARRCAKGKVRRGSRCVARKQRKAKKRAAKNRASNDRRASR